MIPGASRRDFLRASAAWALTCVPAHQALAASPSPSNRTERLADRLVVLSGDADNVVLLLADEGVTMINGGGNDGVTALLQEVTRLADGRPVRRLVNTDWHAEHTGANERLGAEGVEIVAHARTREYLRVTRWVDWQDRRYPARPAQALPTKTIQGAEALTIGREPVEIGPLGQAHTDGDLYLFARTANVLVAGDVLGAAAYPIADYTSGGWLGGLLTATRTLLDMTNAETRIVPGRGPVQTRADLQAQLEMLTAMRERMVKMMKQGMGADDMLASAATREFDARWGDPALFLTTSYRGMWLHVRELGGIV